MTRPAVGPLAICLVLLPSAARPAERSSGVDMLGRPCPASALFCADQSRPEHIFMCGRDQRIAGRVAPIDRVADRPAVAGEVLCARQFSNHFQAGLEARLAGNRLSISATTCGACRRMMGWHFVGDVERLLPRHLHVLQSLLGLPRRPLLGTVAAWRKALAACPLPPRQPVADRFLYASPPPCDPRVSKPAGPIPPNQPTPKK